MSNLKDRFARVLMASSGPAAVIPSFVPCDTSAMSSMSAMSQAALEGASAASGLPASMLQQSGLLTTHSSAIPALPRDVMHALQPNAGTKQGFLTKYKKWIAAVAIASLLIILVISIHTRRSKQVNKKKSRRIKTGKSKGKKVNDHDEKDKTTDDEDDDVSTTGSDVGGDQSDDDDVGDDIPNPVKRPELETPDSDDEDEQPAAVVTPADSPAQKALHVPSAPVLPPDVTVLPPPTPMQVPTSEVVVGTSTQDGVTTLSGMHHSPPVIPSYTPKQSSPDQVPHGHSAHVVSTAQAGPSVPVHSDIRLASDPNDPNFTRII